MVDILVYIIPLHWQRFRIPAWLLSRVECIAPLCLLNHYFSQKAIKFWTLFVIELLLMRMKEIVKPPR